MRDLIDREWNAVLGLWIDAQVNLGKVWRWGTFCDGNPLFRKQHTLEHTYSLLIVGMISIIKLRDFVKLDETLLLQAFVFCISLHGPPRGVAGEVQADCLSAEETR